MKTYKLVSTILYASIALIALKTNAQVINITFSDQGGDALMTWSGSLSENLNLPSYSIGTSDYWGNQSVMLRDGSSYFSSSLIITTDAKTSLFGDAAVRSITHLSGGSFELYIRTSGATFRWEHADTTIVSSGSALISGLDVTTLDSLEWNVGIAGPNALHISAIPEPTTYAAILSAVSLLFVYARRRSITRQSSV